jgi:hypothetical protein
MVTLFGPVCCDAMYSEWLEELILLVLSSGTRSSSRSDAVAVANWMAGV